MVLVDRAWLDLQNRSVLEAEVLMGSLSAWGRHLPSTAVSG